MRQDAYPPAVFLTVFLLIVLLPVFSVMFLSHRKKRKFLALLADRPGASQVRGGGRVESESFLYTYRLHGGAFSLDHLAKTGLWGGIKLELLTAFDAPCSFVLRRRRILDVLWTRRDKQVHRTGYPDFDRRITVTVDNPEFALEYFGSNARRQALLTLIKGDFDVIWAAKGVLHGLKKVSAMGPGEIEKIAGAVSQIKVLTKEIPECRPVRLRKTWIRSALFALIVLSALAAALYSCFAFDALDFFQIAVTGVYLSVPVAAVVLVLGAPFFLRMIPGRPRTAYADTGASFVGLVFISSALLTGTITGLNCAFDDSAERVVTAKIAAKEESDLQIFGIRSLLLESWREKDTVETVWVNEEDYDDAQEETDCLSMLVRDGLLGFPWVQKYALVSGRIDPACLALDGEGEVMPGVSAATNLSDEESQQLDEDPELKSRFDGYYEAVVEQILDNWEWRRTDIILETVAEANLSVKGSLDGIRLVHGSGDATFDSKALEALKDAGPFPKPPPDLAPFFAEIRFTFQSRVRNR